MTFRWPIPRLPIWKSPDIALVSHGIPPGRSGYHFMLEQLLGAIPEERLAIVGIGGPWGNRPRPPFPARRSAPRYWEGVLAAAAVGLTERFAPRIYPRMLPNVRRIFATLDPTLGVATSWAKSTGAELWVYAIDLHAADYWGAGIFGRNRLLRWQLEAFQSAKRAFAISEGMADWLRSRGVDRPIEILPPLYPVGDAIALLEGPVRFLMSGAVYSFNAGPLRWLERAVSELAPTAQLRMITSTPDDSLTKAGLNLAYWSKASVAPGEVKDEVARATWGVIGMDSGRTEDDERVAWPTKLREFLSVGRPILCIARPDSAIARIVAKASWGLGAFGEEETRAAVVRIMSESRQELEARARAAHAFALQNIDDNTIGAAVRRDLCA
jgi:hypothetical protein